MRTNCERYSEMEGKKEALEIAKEFAACGRIFDRDQDRSSIMLLGKFGVGKSWLGTAIFKDIIYRTRNGKWIVYLDMVKLIQDGYDDGKSRRTIDFLKTCKVLMIDDFGNMSRDEETIDRQEIVYEILNYRNTHFLPVILTTNLKPSHAAEQFSERTYERIREMAAVVEMKGANLREVSL